MINEFIFNGISSNDYNLKIKESNHTSVPFGTYEEINVPGRIGTLVIDNKGYENRTIDVVVYIDNRDTKESIHEYARRLHSWLRSNMEYKKLIFSDDSDFYLEAICINQLDFEEIIENFAEVQLTFLCKPFKKHVNEDKIVLTTSRVINNMYMNSRPLIKIVGNGDITLNINNQILELNGVESEIEVDSELMNAYKIVNGKTVLQNNKMYSDFPIIEPGQNNISWSGNVTRVEITPRWAVL